MAQDSDFTQVTEIAGAPVSNEQLRKLYARYCWAMQYCRGRDVVEVGCGAGPGLGAFAAVAKSVVAGDLCPELVGVARRHYGDRIAISVWGAENLPFSDSSKDVIYMAEALYYLGEPEVFVQESARVLRAGGTLLLVNVNPDVWDFHRSQFSCRYFGVRDLRALLEGEGFQVTIYGSSPIGSMSLRQRLLRPAKKLAAALGLIPKTMAGKRWIRRMVFGPEVLMPAEIRCGDLPFPEPELIDQFAPNRSHQILHCVATRSDNSN